MAKPGTISCARATVSLCSMGQRPAPRISARGMVVGTSPLSVDFSPGSGHGGRCEPALARFGAPPAPTSPAVAAALLLDVAQGDRVVYRVVRVLGHADGLVVPLPPALGIRPG